MSPTITGSTLYPTLIHATLTIFFKTVQAKIFTTSSFTLYLILGFCLISDRFNFGFLIFDCKLLRSSSLYGDDVIIEVLPLRRVVRFGLFSTRGKGIISEGDTRYCESASRLQLGVVGILLVDSVCNATDVDVEEVSDNVMTGKAEICSTSGSRKIDDSKDDVEGKVFVTEALVAFSTCKIISVVSAAAKSASLNTFRSVGYMPVLEKPEGILH